MERLIQDVRFALRQLRRNLGFTAIVVATLAIGIGANATIFSAVNELLLRPLPYPEADQLVNLSGSYQGRGDDWSVSYPNAVSWRELNRTFEEVAWFQSAGYGLVGGQRPERIEGLRTSSTLFPLLHVNPVLGRTYTAEEDVRDGARVAVISYALWQRHFGGERDAPGKTITLSGTEYTVIGVLPQGFTFPQPGIDIYTPLQVSEETWGRSNGGLGVIARMRPDVDLAAVRADMQRVSKQLAEEFPGPNGDLSAFVRPLKEALFGDELPLILVTMLGAVAFVLLIACVNVANLLLARATGREREIAVRAAIGAGRARVMSQLLTESVLLAILGGAAGTVLAVWGTQLLRGAVPEGAAFARDFAVDGTVLLFALALSVLTGVLFGLAPALAAARTDLASFLVGRTGHQTRQRGQRRNLLVVTEVALALVLLVGAGLMVRSFARLTATSPGFDPTALLTMRVGIDRSYDSLSHRLAFQARVLEQVRAVSGVRSAAAVDWIPLSGTNNFNDFYIEGRDGNENAGNVIVSDGYFTAMGIPIDRGRAFDTRDHASAPPVVVVSHAFAEKYFKGADPIGKRIRMGWDSPDNWRTIVGVSGSVRHGGIDEDPRAEIYAPYAQLPWSFGSFAIVARVEGDPQTFASTVQEAVWSVDPNQMIYQVRTGQKLIGESGRVFIGRIMAITIGFFGVVALTLAALGLYGVISYGVAQRTYEIGVRTALGATRADVLRMVINQGLRLVVAGLAIGLIGAFALSRVMASLLFGIGARDPITFLGVTAALLATAALASGIPALRAARVDPVIALRTE